MCETSILGEFQRGDPVTDPHLKGSVRISPPARTHQRTKQMMGLSKDTCTYTGDKHHMYTRFDFTLFCPFSNRFKGLQGMSPAHVNHFDLPLCLQSAIVLNISRFTQCMAGHSVCAWCATWWDNYTKTALHNKYNTHRLII